MGIVVKEFPKADQIQYGRLASAKMNHRGNEWIVHQYKDGVRKYFKNGAGCDDFVVPSDIREQLDEAAYGKAFG